MTSLNDAALVDLPPTWADFTSENEGVPTLCRDSEEGVGALQFTIATYVGGKEPRPSDADLLSLLGSSPATRRAGEPIDTTLFTSGTVRWATSSFRHPDGDTFLRVWYGSDGLNIAIATYNCAWADREVESADADSIMRSFRFSNEDHAQAP